MQSQPIDTTHHDNEDRQALPKEGRDPKLASLIGVLACWLLIWWMEREIVIMLTVREQ